MTKDDERARQDLVFNIESGRYKMDDKESMSGAIIIIALMTIVLIIMVIFDLASPKYRGRTVGDALTLVACFVPVILVIIMGVLAIKHAGKDRLGGITEKQYQLIMHGEKIEAYLDSIEEVGTYYALKCSAEYKGEKRLFESSTVKIKPLPFDERKVDVYINPDDPSQYVVDIYSHLPMTGGDVLHDRSELKRQPNSKPNNRLSRMVIIALIVVAIGLSFVFMMSGFFMFTINAPEVGIIFFLCIPLTLAPIIFGLIKQTKTTKDVLSDGYYLIATGLRYWVTTSDDRKTYHLSVRYIEPKTRQYHDFRTTGPSSMKNLVDAKVRVYIDPDNLNKYYIDIKSSLEDIGFTASETKE